MLRPLKLFGVMLAALLGLLGAGACGQPASQTGGRHDAAAVPAIVFVATDAGTVKPAEAGDIIEVRLLDMIPPWNTTEISGDAHYRIEPAQQIALQGKTLTAFRVRVLSAGKLSLVFARRAEPPERLAFAVSVR